jgi:threonine synthase
VRYVSTRGDAPSLNFVEVTLAGLARDGGLYVPETWPQLDRDTIAGFAGKPYAEVAVEVIRPFVGDAIAPADLARMVREAYDTFRHPAVAPLAQLGPGTFVLELFHGPTLAFKDLAMQLLGRLMDHVLAKRREHTTVVVATSGDTGGAAVEAFRGRAQVDLVVLFPNGRISDVQRRMITTAPDANVHALAINGTFDDCQAIVKGLFNHHAFRDALRLSGVNSINIARIVAQIVYYFTAAVALGAPARKVAFTVPTGNFGDIFAGYAAARMGLPIDRLVIATNVNDILARALKSGAYEVHEVKPTASPSMDIQVASNFERALFEAMGRDARAVRTMMASLAQARRFVIPARALADLRGVFGADCADEQETAATIRTVRREAGTLIDPHTAVAIAVAEKEQRDAAAPMIVLSTAHAAKFPDAVEAACGVRPALPDWLADLPRKPERQTVLAADQTAVEHFISSVSRVAREGAAA